MKLVWLFPLVLLNITIMAQNIPIERLTNWSSVGNPNLDTTNYEVISAIDIGLISDGNTDNSLALNSFLSSPSSKKKVLFFPIGNYSFNSTIYPSDSILFKGENADSTRFIFNLNGAGNAIHISGTKDNQAHLFLQDAPSFQNYILIENASDFTPLTWLEITQEDSQWVTSSWALGSVSQFVQISHIVGDTIHLLSELRNTYNIFNNAKVYQVQPKTHIGFECIGMERIDNTAPQQTSTLFFNYANSCWAKGLEMNKCTFGHIELSHSSQIHIENCYIHHAHEYGDGGRGYGVVLHFGTGECLIENNVFEHLRHSVLLQAGANGNVISYNHSFDPYWATSSPFIPSNSAGELVLHGNYVYRNLFEMNSVQNIVIDNSHGPNGPYNTFLRNRASLFGIFFSADNSPSQNFIGNEIPNTNFPYSSVNYTILGTDHFLFGNNNKGNIDPTGTENPSTSSLVYSNSPLFLNGEELGQIGAPNVMNSYSIPAEYRSVNNQPLAGACNLELVTNSIELESIAVSAYPNPFLDELNIKSQHYIDVIQIFESSGKLIRTKLNCGRNSKIEVGDLKKGAYYIQIETKLGCSFVQVLKIE
jgi:Secretion system C-terminal sorting domain